MPPSIPPRRGSTSCLPSTRSSISGSACIYSSGTSTASRPTSPGTSGGSATSPSRCWSGTKSQPLSISRPTASSASSWCSAGPGSAIARAHRAGDGSKKPCTASSASSSPAERREHPSSARARSEGSYRHCARGESALGLPSRHARIVEAGAYRLDPSNHLETAAHGPRYRAGVGSARPGDRRSGRGLRRDRCRGSECRRLFFAWGSVCGQTYPAKPVKLIVTYPPGGSSDLMARVFGAKLSELWGQQVIVESKPGAAGSIGMDFAAKQPPDGYSFVIGNSGPVAINPLLSSVPYSIERDFVAVSMISTGPNVLVVRADSPHKSLADVISFARENPGMLNYGTSGPGSISHLSSEMLKSLTRVQAVEVPYKGGVLAVQDLLGNQIHFIFSDTLPAMQHIRAGKLRALCITGAEPFALLPELAPCQAAAPGLVAVNWLGVLMPAGTPRSLVATLNGDRVKALPDPDVKKKFADLGVEAVSSTPEQFAAFIRTEMDKYGRLIKEANIKVNP